MRNGNYSLDLSLFFFYNRDIDKVGEQSFNDCYGQLTNINDVLIITFFGIEVVSCSLFLFEISDSFLQDSWCRNLWVYYAVFTVINRINCCVDVFIGFVYHDCSHYQLAVDKTISRYSVQSITQISS